MPPTASDQRTRHHNHSSPVNLIVNADDLGISPAVNTAAFSLMSEGRITSATLLANGPAIEDAVRSVSHFPHCSFGAHLNVVEFEPLSRSLGPELTRGSSSMSRAAVQKYAAQGRFRQAVYEEFHAQVSRLLQWGVPVSHLDSHQHAHTLPALFPVVKAIQRNFGIRRIRISRNIYAPSDHISPLLRAKKILFNEALRFVYKSRTTGGMTDLETLLAIGAIDIGAIGRDRFRSIEVMVHPGPGVLEKEVLLLKSDWRARLGFPSKLVSYFAL